MKNSLLQLCCFLLLVIVLAGSCRQSYEPPAVKLDYKFLVVEGNINTAPSGGTTIKLSRTKMIDDTTTFVPEAFGNVLIESETGMLYQLIELSPGTYISGSLNLNSSLKYRLRITTAGQEQVLSDFTSSAVSPPIDSITWQQNEDVDIYVYTHDPSNQTRYYQWEYIETWEYDSRLESAWGVKNGLAYPIDPSEQVHTCWIDSYSTEINVASSVKLSEDVISKHPLAAVPTGSDRIGKRYSILAKQYALTKEAYDYWQLIRKNTEHLGTLFDAQPAQLTGNIHNVSDPGQPVIGYISAGITQEKRIFIAKDEVDWVPIITPAFCQIITIPQNSGNILIYDYPDPAYTVYYFVTGGIVISKKDCVDCTVRGGKNVKPAFW